MGNCEKGPAAHITQQYLNMLIIQHRFAVITFPIKIPTFVTSVFTSTSEYHINCPYCGGVEPLRQSTSPDG